MKNNIIVIWVIVLSFLHGSCGDYLDLTPKGATILDNITDLEYLLNGSYEGSAFCFDNNLCVVTNESYGKRMDPSTTIANGVGLTYALMAYDESVDRYVYTVSDFMYERYYKTINNMNVLLDKIGGADGDVFTKARLSAEAKIMRAYWHYLLVNVYAKQYDESTASSLGGIPYVTNVQVEEVKKKLTLEEVYRCLLADCSDEILEALPEESANILRPGKAMGYALRSKIYLQMKKYDRALVDVEKALSYNGHIDNRLPVITERLYAREKDDASIIFYAGMATGYPLGCLVSQETAKLFEPGDILMNYGRWGLTGNDDDLGIWNIKMAAQYKNGIEGEIYMWYNQSSSLPAAGITSDQLYYIKAECLIRAGHYQDGLDEVNKVRKYRIDPAVYQDLTAQTEKEAMEKLMKAKRIECLFTYNNFFDLKRWNSEEHYKQTITRTVGDKTYTLSPDSPLWVFPFPANAVKHNPTLEQNY